MLLTNLQLIFERRTETERVLVAVNADSQPYTAHFDAGCGLAWDLISGQQHDFGGGSQLPHTARFSGRWSGKIKKCPLPWQRDILLFCVFGNSARPIGKQRGQGLGKRRAADPLFRDDAGDQAVVGDVKGRIEALHPGGGHGLPVPQGADLLRIPLLDGDVVPVGTVQVDGGGGPQHIEGDPVVFGQGWPTPLVPILLAASPLAATRSQPTKQAWTHPFFITIEAMLSQIRVTSTPA